MDQVKKMMEGINGERPRLAPRLPLSMPLSISVTTANICNLECEFCAISEKGRARNKNLLTPDTFDLFVDRLKEAGWHLKQIVLVGLGEPLINPDIVSYVRKLKESGCVDKVHIVTNGVLLKHEMTDALLEAGLDVLRVSINGLTGEDYQKYTNRKVDCDELVNNLRYFGEKKPASTKLYIKIMDYMVNTDEKLAYYHGLYDGFADAVNVEYLTEMSTTIDYSKVSEKTRRRGLKGFEITETKICPLSFYHIYLNAEGTISACCVAGPWSTPPALMIGDLHESSFKEIWTGKKFTDFQLRMLLEGKDKAHETCRKCVAYESYIYPEDVITEKDAEEIAERINNR